MVYGKNIRRIRQRKGLSQRQLAERIGRSVPCISYYETNRRNPNDVTLERIAEALGASVSELKCMQPESKEAILMVEELESALRFNCEAVNDAARRNDLRRNLICFGRASMLCELLNAYGDGPVELVDAWENCYEIIKGINMDGEFSPVTGGDWFD